MASTTPKAISASSKTPEGSSLGMPFQGFRGNHWQVEKGIHTLKACSKLWTPCLCPHTSAQLSIAMGPLIFKTSSVFMCTRCDSIIASSSWLQTQLLRLLGQMQQWCSMLFQVVSPSTGLGIHMANAGSHESMLILQSLDIALMLRKDSGMSEM